MRKIENSKYYIQVFDILDFQDNISIPLSVWKKITDAKTLDNIVDNEFYIEMESEEELELFNILNFVFIVDELDSMSVEQLEEERNNLDNELTSLSAVIEQEQDDMKKEVIKDNMKVISYKIKSLDEYIKKRKREARK